MTPSLFITRLMIAIAYIVQLPFKDSELDNKLKDHQTSGNNKPAEAYR